MDKISKAYTILKNSEPVKMSLLGGNNDYTRKGISQQKLQDIGKILGSDFSEMPMYYTSKSLFNDSYLKDSAYDTHSRRTKSLEEKKNNYLYRHLYDYLYDLDNNYGNHSTVFYTAPSGAKMDKYSKFSLLNFKQLLDSVYNMVQYNNDKFGKNYPTKAVLAQVPLSDVIKANDLYDKERLTPWRDSASEIVSKSMTPVKAYNIENLLSMDLPELGEYLKSETGGKLLSDRNCKYVMKDMSDWYNKNAEDYECNSSIIDALSGCV